MVVDHGAEKIVRRGDGVKISGEVEVHIFHGNNLGIAATGCSSFHAKTGAERGFADADYRLFVNGVESIAKPYSGSGFTLACWCRGNRSNQDKFAIFALLYAFDELC